MTATITPRSRDELCDWLRSRPGRVRVCGRGTQAVALPDPEPCQRLQTTGLAGIERLDAGDQTCSVDAGLERARLDEALAPHGLELPCLGAGTLGGLFAADPCGAATTGGPGPRSLLLGMQAVLADGTPFRSGARVVKSVAGFDVHKLLVGSCGRLFVATRLYLRLKPRPRAAQWFANEGLERDEALRLLQRLRGLRLPPSVIAVTRDAGGAMAVRGRIAGRASFVAATMRSLALCASEGAVAPGLAAGAGELLRGTVLASRLAALLDHVPATSVFVWYGGGRFEVTGATPADSDALLAAVPSVPAQVVLVGGASHRRGLGTALDPGQRQLEQRLKRALDPDGVLV